MDRMQRAKGLMSAQRPLPENGAQHDGKVAHDHGNGKNKIDRKHPIHAQAKIGGSFNLHEEDIICHGRQGITENKNHYPAGAGIKAATQKG